MAHITNLPLVRHVRSEPSVQTLHYRGGQLRRSGRGLAFWFRPLATAVAEVPLDDRELSFVFGARSRDFQQVTVQGAVTYRLVAPEALAERVDFTIDLQTGRWLRAPLEQVNGLMTQLAQQLTLDYLTGTPLQSILRDGLSEARRRIADGLRAEALLADLGVGVAAVRVAAITPEPEVERALQTPAREGVQREADEATFARRAGAVEKERAIAENELESQVELARREEALVEQRGANERRRAEEQAAAQAIEATAESERIEVLQRARVTAERERMAVYQDLPPAVLWGLAGRELAGKLKRIDHLNVSPDVLTPLLANLAETGTRRLEKGG